MSIAAAELVFNSWLQELHLKAAITSPQPGVSGGDQIVT